MTKSFVAHRPKPAAGSGIGPKAGPNKAPGRPLAKGAEAPKRPKETGGPSGPEPTRYGDWERKGICVDF